MVVSDTQLLSNMTTILTYNLTINLFMVYLISVLIFVLSVRFLINIELVLDIVKYLGKYPHLILSKIFNI